MSDPTSAESGAPQDGTPPRRAGSLFEDPERAAQQGAVPPPPPRPPATAFGQPSAQGTWGAAAPGGAPGWQAPPPGQPAWQPAPGGAPQFAQPVPGGAQFVRPGAAPPPPADGRVPWSWWVGPVAVFAGFLVVIGAALIIGLGAGALGSDPETLEDSLTSVLTLMQQVLWIFTAVLVPFFVVRWLRAEHLGLARPRSLGRAVGIGVATMITFYVLAAIYSAALGLDENSNELLKDTGFGSSVLRDVVLAGVFTIGAPVSEELLFRALLFGSLAAGFTRGIGAAGPYVAAVISGVVFGAIHAGQGQDKYLPMLMILGVLLCLSYYWSGTLYVPIAIHSINNTVATAASADPTTNWIYLLLACAPVLSVLLAIGIGRFVRARFRSEPPLPPPPAPIMFTPPHGRPAGL